jgi:hypothetical protein
MKGLVKRLYFFLTHADQDLGQGLLKIVVGV